MISYLAIHGTRQIPSGAFVTGELRRFRLLGYFSLLFFAYGITIFQIAIAFIEARDIDGSTGGRIFAAVIAFSAAWMIFVFGLVGASAQRQQPPGNAVAEGDTTPDECWKWGMVYYNPDDPAFLVDKRAGWGWTLNYGNKWSWVLSLLIVLAPFVLRFFWFS